MNVWNGTSELARATVWAFLISYLNLAIAPFVPFEITLVVTFGALVLFVQGYRVERRLGRWLQCPDCSLRIRSSDFHTTWDILWEHRETVHHHTTE